MKAARLVFLFAFALVLAAGMTASAQQLGSISGTVMDPQGAVIPGAKIIARESQTNAVYTLTTDEKGNFDFPALPFGIYTVTIEAGGFRKWESTNIRVISGQPTTLKASLEVGSVSETVTVEAASEVVNVVSPELLHNVDRKQMINLPLPTRNPVDFVSLQPGFQSPAGIRSGRIHGLRGQTNNITQDGINAQDNTVRTDGQFALTAPTTDQIGEISISTGTVGSDSGAGVAQIRFVTQKGTNDLHGSVFYNHRNDVFNANSFENNQRGNKADGTPVAPKERLRQHTFGVNSGGPVWLPKIYNGRDRTFFFARYEGFRENFAATRNRTVLTQLARTGTFQYRTNCTTACPAGIVNNQLISVNLLTNTAFNTRNLTANTITGALVGATPLPNNTLVGDGLNTQGFTFPITGTDPNNRYNIRIDHKLIDGKGWGTHWLEVNWSWGSFILTPDTFNGIEPAFPEGVATSCVDGVCMGAEQSSKRMLLAVALNSQLGPTMFNELRGGFQRAPVLFNRTGVNPRSFLLSFPLISNPEQNFLTQGRITPFYTLIDNWSKVKGSHTVRAGFDYSSTNGILFNDAGILPNVTLGSNSNNSVGFLQTTFGSAAAPGTASISTADFGRAQSLMVILSGLVTSRAQTFHLASPDSGFAPFQTRLDHVRERAYMGYAMDIWRAFPSLTVTYGSRYELVRPVDTVNGIIAMPTGNQLGFFQPYDPFDIFSIDSSVTVTQLRNGTVTPTQLELVRRNRLWDTDRNNFAPFMGIAYSPNSDNPILSFVFGKGGKGALRGGFSSSFVRDGLTVATNSRTGNTGAQTTVTSTNLGPTSTPPITVITSAGVPAATPLFAEPISQLSNFRITGGSNIFTYDRNLRTPYVLQWSLGIEREILPQTRFEVRYVGNHAVKLLRGLDLNQIGLLDNGMLAEFQAAKTNLACNLTASVNSWANRGTACNVPLPIVSQMGPATDPLLAAQFTSSTRIQNLNENQAGEWAHQLSLAAFVNHLGQSASALTPCQTPGTCVPGLGNFALNFFRANPLIVNGNIIGNHSHSYYHGLEVEVFRRFSRGFLLQGNYTFAKTITDADGASQSELFPALSLTDPRRERTRASFDLTHVFNANSIWEIPVGRGRRYLSGGIIGKVLEGWQAGGIWRWFSGRPTNIQSGRGTLNRGAQSGTNEAVFLGGINAQKVCDDAGIHKTPQGVFWLPTEYLRSPGGGTTTGASTALFGHPAAGTLGDLGNRFKCNGPGFFRVDMNFVKRTYITEQINFEFRAEFFNLFNNPNFRTSTQNYTIDGTGFGRLTSVDTPREIQFNLRINW